MSKAIIFPIIIALCAAASLTAEDPQFPGIVGALHFGSRQPTWRPDWPDDVPPDAFAVRGSRVPRSLTVTVEATGEGAADGPGAEYAAAWSPPGSVVRRPLFTPGAAYSLSLDYDAAGRVRGYKVEPLAEEAGAGGSPAPSGETVVLAYGPDGSLVSAERKSEGKRTAVSFAREGDRLEELSFDEEGVPTGRVSWRFAGEHLVAADVYGENGEVSASIRYDYDSDGRAVRVEAGEYAAEAFYDASGRPRLLSVRSGPEGKTEVRRYQWDERGLLVKEFSTDDEGTEFETAYTYAFDAAGEWIVRDSARMVERFGAGFPEKGPRVLRKIHY
jgi:YD repeat-containing protein